MRESSLFKWFRLCPLLLFVVFQVVLYSSAHYHIVGGRTRFHSHPWTDANHNHSAEEIATIDLLSHFFADEMSDGFQLVQPFYYPPSVDEAEMTSPIFTFTTRNAKPRDPPICFV